MHVRASFSLISRLGTDTQPLYIETSLFSNLCMPSQHRPIDGLLEEILKNVELTTAESSYAHGIRMYARGVREVDHAFQREQRQRNEALQRLDEAYRVVLYLHRKLESLKDTIIDLINGEDIKVALKDYDEDLEVLEGR
ncbi:hypothetical protein B0A55_06328 [Friedmanniomyces simplex]|uniref:Uncharacterized protein n=1 Tax=Friedmanniomyces simplex TaxID=329884 RepID=A0A4U0X6I8_9PEZI|nr:hypothetical protein B0A55_06328 [Friedmanniomyces simplex]